MLPSLLGNKKEQSCHVLFLEMYNIVKTGKKHLKKNFACDLSIFLGTLLPNSLQHKEPWYSWQAQLICSKLKILSWRLMGCLHIRHGSQTLMYHWLPWLEAASWAGTTQSQGSLPAASQPSTALPFQAARNLA